MKSNRIRFRHNPFVLIVNFKQRIFDSFNKLYRDLQIHWVEVALVITFIAGFKKNGPPSMYFGEDSTTPRQSIGAQPMNTSLHNDPDSKESGQDDNIANTYSNLIYTNEAFATKDPAKLAALKRRKQKAYIEQYYEIAQKEMAKHGIPASITLAQGLLESNVGESKLAKRNKNHFGIKCFSRTCKRGHCSNFEDDSHKDFFRIFKSPAESFRAHSMLLQKARYKPLFDLDVKDYKGWAHGLKKAGYATDPKYGFKLVNLIDELGLDQYVDLE